MKKLFTLFLAMCLTMTSTVVVYADNISQIIGDNNTVVFVDVPDHYWAKDDIYYFTQRGIVNGTGGNNFEPDAGVTREQFAKMLVLTFNAPLTSPSEATFADVSKDKWSYTYVETSKNFLTGYANPFGGAPSFHPGTNATREDIAVALVRMMGLTDKDAYNTNYAYNFIDAGDISPALLSYVSIAADRGLVQGYGDGTFGPQKGITRAETVTMLNRATKQAVSNINAELELYANTVTGEDPKEVTIIIQTEEGASVTIDGQEVKMERDYDGNYVGAYLHKFEEEGSKNFTIEAAKAGKKKSTQVTAKYEIGLPVLNITQSPTVVTKKDVIIKGTLKAGDDSNDVSLTINGNPVSIYYGQWSETFTLKEGDNELTFIATNAGGKSVTETKTIRFDVGGPQFKITQCPVSVTSKEVTIKGTLTDSNYDVSLTINGNPVSIYYGQWSETFTLKEGDNELIFIATNGGGKSVTETKTITLTVGSPTITFVNCPETTTQRNLTIIGSIGGEKTDIYLFVNDKQWSVSNDGSFQQNVMLNEGTNTFTFRAVNSFGKEVVTKTISYIAPSVEE